MIDYKIRKIIDTVQQQLGVDTKVSIGKNVSGVWYCTIVTPPNTRTTRYFDLTEKYKVIVDKIVAPELLDRI